jgi:phage tail-like protein
MAEAAAKAPKAQSGAAPGVFVDPLRAFNFKLMILGITEAHFTQCSGLGIRIDPISYVEGGSPVEHQIPGQAHYDPVVLQFGFTQSRELWDWMMSAVKQPVQRKNVQILVLDADGVTEKVRWTLYNAWPSAWRGAELNAMGPSRVAIHTLELVYENVEQQ